MNLLLQKAARRKVAATAQPVGADHLRSGFQPDEQRFDFFPRPWGFAQEGQARFDAGITFETTDIDALRQPVPTVPSLQLDKYGFERHAMKRVFRRFSHS
jgi:hypothetical protein